MIINKENLRRFFYRRIDKCKTPLDVATLMHILNFLREYKPKEKSDDLKYEYKKGWKDAYNHYKCRFRR